jgi:hypothetical protein
VVLATLLAPLGCGQARDERAAEEQAVARGAETIQGDSRCADRDGSPVRARQVMDVLRNHGFSVYGVEDPVCRSQLVVQFSNALSERSDAKVADVDELRKREGHLICDVETELSPAARENPWRLRTFDDGEHGVQVNIANVTCVLFADENKQELVHRLKRSLLSLPRPG